MNTQFLRSMRGILVLLLIAVLLPVFLLQVGIYYRWYRDRRKAEFQANLEVARAVAATFEGYLRDIRRQERAIGEALVLLKFSHPERTHDYLLQNLKEYPSLQAIHWISPQGKVIGSSDPAAYGLDMAGQPAIRPLIEGKDMAVGDLVRSHTTDEPVFAVSRRICSPEKKLLGIVCAIVQPSKLDALTIDINRPDDGGFSIIDARGMLVYRNPPLSLTWKQREWGQLYKIVGDTLATGNEGMDTVVPNYDTRRRIIVSTPIRSIGWAASAGRPEALALGPIFRDLARDFMMLVGISVLVFVVALVFTRQINYPLRQLEEQALALGQGNLRQSIPLPGITELKNLARTFNQMARSIQDREAQINQERDFSRAVLKTAGAIICVLDRKGCFLSFNRACEQISGYALEEIRDRPFWEFLLLPEEAGGVKTAFDRLVAGDFSHSYQNHWITKSGERRLISWSNTAMVDAEGKVKFVIGTGIDITETNRAQAALRRLNDELETRVRQRTEELARSNAELEQFAYVASHDLQEPLRMVASYVQLLEKRYKNQLDEKALQYIGFAADGAQRMQRLITDLLEYSRVRTHGSPLEPTDCNEVLGQVLANLRLAIEEQQAKVTHDPLPMVPADHTQLAQIFQNLIQNGLKFHRSDEPSRIHVGAEHRNGEWLFSVRDNGIGIEPQHFDRIFVIFQRLHPRREYPGTGIGLSLVKRIVERHGGRIWVESEPGRGTTFYFTVPEEGAKRHV
jgi:PAS domain S-box-containing protein